MDRSILLNPADVEADRACWHIYLAGGKNIYTSYCDAFFRRVWCVCEVFVFLQMGGFPQQVIMRVTWNQAESTRLTEATSCFDVRILRDAEKKMLFNRI